MAFDGVISHANLLTLLKMCRLCLHTHRGQRVRLQADCTDHSHMVALNEHGNGRSTASGSASLPGSHFHDVVDGVVAFAHGHTHPLSDVLLPGTFDTLDPTRPGTEWILTPHGGGGHESHSHEVLLAPGVKTLSTVDAGHAHAVVDGVVQPAASSEGGPTHSHGLAPKRTPGFDHDAAAVAWPLQASMTDYCDIRHLEDPAAFAARATCSPGVPSMPGCQMARCTNPRQTACGLVESAAGLIDMQNDPYIARHMSAQNRL